MFANLSTGEKEAKHDTRVVKVIQAEVFCCFFFGCIGSLLLRWVFVAERGLSLSRATLCCSAWASHCSGFSCCRVLALGAQASVVVAHGLSSCGTQV